MSVAGLYAQKCILCTNFQGKTVSSLAVLRLLCVHMGEDCIQRLMCIVYVSSICKRNMLITCMIDAECMQVFGYKTHYVMGE